MKHKQIWLLVTSTSTCAAIYYTVGNYHRLRQKLSDFVQRPKDVDHLRLLSIAHSKNIKSRRFGVRAIGGLVNLQDWKIMQISQFSEPPVIAALMLKGVPLEKFLKPIVPLTDKGSLEQSVHNLLTVLNLQSLDFCIKFYTDQALHKPVTVHTSDELDLLWSDAEEFVDPKTMSERPDVKRLIVYAKALDAHSSMPSQCRQIVEERGLDVLMRLWRFAEQFDVETEIVLRSLILKVLSNIALDRDLKRFLVITGWMPILKQCSVSEKISYNLLGLKVLQNISYDLKNEPKADAGVFILHDSQLTDDASPTLDVVFIHGLRGSLFWSWRQKDKNQLPAEIVLNFTSSEPRTACWPKDWLPDDAQGHLRIIGVDYTSFLSDWVPKCFDKSTKNLLEARSREFMKKLRLAGVGERPIIWVAHSMGGLFLKQMLRCSDRDGDALLSNTAGCVFYSVPHYGSPVATRSVESHYRHILWPSIEVNELREDSPYLIKLHADFRRIVERRRIEIINFAETLPTKLPMNFSLICVPERSAYGGFGRYYRLKESHFNVCKPASRNSMNYQILVQFVNEVLENIETYKNI